ncbi:MAG: hypothetical protein GY952_00155 [Rhodobacteraceae bacterium]|nr:hypothetical protein [Paracoccaceae bacterium]
MRFTAVLMILLATTGQAFAHGGHWADLAGHDHWLAAGALAAAAALAAWAALQGKGEKEPSEPEAEGAEPVSQET